MQNIREFINENSNNGEDLIELLKTRFDFDDKQVKKLSVIFDQNPKISTTNYNIKSLDNIKKSVWYKILDKKTPLFNYGTLFRISKFLTEMQGYTFVTEVINYKKTKGAKRMVHWGKLQSGLFLPLKDVYAMQFGRDQIFLNDAY